MNRNNTGTLFEQHSYPETKHTTSKWDAKATTLAADFIPDEFDVICARGKHAWNHPGNKFFRSLVEKQVSNYKRCSSKAERSEIVSNIVEAVRRKGGSGFVKFDPNGRGWVEVGDLLAREKCGQLFRNALSTKYKSSVAAKRVRKSGTAGRKIHDELNQLLFSNQFIRGTMDQVHSETSRHLSDEEAVAMFTQANMVVLNAIKSDATMLPRFNDIVSSSAAVDSMVDDDEVMSVSS